MIAVRMCRSLALSGALLGLLLLGGCASRQPETKVEQPAVTPLPLPPAFGPQEIVGRWGYASFTKAEDRARTEAAARRQCGKPYIIGRGPSGGVMMHLADQAKPAELQLKGGSDGKTYIGPGPEPAGAQDREVISFDGRVLILHWMDSEVQSRYGYGVYVRCAPRA